MLTMTATAAALIAGWIALYIHVRMYPWKPCRACNGSGERRSKDGRSIGDCPKCHNQDSRKKRPRKLAKIMGILR